MMKKPALFAALALALLSANMSSASRQREQDDVREDTRNGKVKKFRQIESSIVARMRGMQYLGPEYDAPTQVYRLKFIDRDRVIFVDVDARTGEILRQR